MTDPFAAVMGAGRGRPRQPLGAGQVLVRFEWEPVEAWLPSVPGGEPWVGVALGGVARLTRPVTELPMDLGREFGLWVAASYDVYGAHKWEPLLASGETDTFEFVGEAAVVRVTGIVRPPLSFHENRTSRF
jgi:hypothetical protein